MALVVRDIFKTLKIQSSYRNYKWDLDRIKPMWVLSLTPFHQVFLYLISFYLWSLFHNNYQFTQKKKKKNITQKVQMKVSNVHRWHINPTPLIKNSVGIEFFEVIWHPDAHPESHFPTWICSLGAGLQRMFSSMPFILVDFRPPPSLVLHIWHLFTFKNIAPERNTGYWKSHIPWPRLKLLL